MLKKSLIVLILLSSLAFSGCITGNGCDTESPEATSAPPTTTTNPPTTQPPTTASPTTTPPATNTPPNNVPPPVQHGNVNWMYYDEALEAQAQDDKHIILYFWRDNCPFCVAMDDNTFLDPDVVAYIEEHFHPVEVDIWSREPWSEKNADITGVYLGNLFKLRGAAPGYGFITPNEEILLPMMGYMDSDEYLIFLEFISTFTYNEMSYQEFWNSKQN